MHVLCARPREARGSAVTCVSAPWDTWEGARKARSFPRGRPRPAVPLASLQVCWPHSSLSLIWYLPFREHLLFPTEEVLGVGHFCELGENVCHSCLLKQTDSVVRSGSLLFSEVSGCRRAPL